MKQSPASIKRTLKKLRKIIEDKSTDVETKRMAYFAETTLRWATEDTVRWNRPEDDLQDEVFLIKREAAKQGLHLTAAGVGTVGQKPSSGGK